MFTPIVRRILVDATAKSNLALSDPKRTLRERQGEICARTCNRIASTHYDIWRARLTPRAWVVSEGGCQGPSRPRFTQLFLIERMNAS
jgi:hypothetical protein